MDRDFFAYLQQLELMAFFSGYPLVYLVVLFISGNRQPGNDFKQRVAKLLPLAYAVTGTLYLGLQLKNLYPDFSIENIKITVQQPLLITWALLSLLFWIPALRKKPVLSLLHSLVFFFFLVRDLIVHSFQGTADKNVVRNDMKIYTDSLLLNFGILLIIILLSLMIDRIKRQHRNSRP